MKLLALDSSTEACSVALSIDGVIHDRFTQSPRQHTQQLLPMVDGLLSEAGISVGGLDAIAFARGPGSFTGLRICLGAVQGLAFGADLPVVPISTLAVLAQTAAGVATADSTVVAAIDARMDEIYWAAYCIVASCTDHGLVEAVTEEYLCAPEQLSSSMLPDGLVSYAGVGSGWRYGNRIPLNAVLAYRDDQALPMARALAILAGDAFGRGMAVSASAALPVYLRDEVAWQKVVP